MPLYSDAKLICKRDPRPFIAFLKVLSEHGSAKISQWLSVSSSFINRPGLVTTSPVCPAVTEQYMTKIKVYCQKSAAAK